MDCGTAEKTLRLALKLRQKVYIHQMSQLAMQAELNRIPGVTAAGVTRSLVDLQGGYYWTVSFDGNNGNLVE